VAFDCEESTVDERSVVARWLPLQATTSPIASRHVERCAEVFMIERAKRIGKNNHCLNANECTEFKLRKKASLQKKNVRSTVINSHLEKRLQPAAI
jgi:hypothetical protein